MTVEVKTKGELTKTKIFLLKPMSTAPHCPNKGFYRILTSPCCDTWSSSRTCTCNCRARLPYLCVQQIFHTFLRKVLSSTYVGRPANLRSFLAANSTQKNFLIECSVFFCDIRDKSALFNILRQNVTIFCIGNEYVEREEIKRKWGTVESECFLKNVEKLHTVN